MSAAFARGVWVVMATDGHWQRYWAVASSREVALTIVKPLIPEGYTASLTPFRLDTAQVAHLKLEQGTAREIMYEPKNSN